MVRRVRHAYCIDLNAKTINAICYGAGYDRTVEYGVDEPAEPINWLWSGIDTDGSVFNNGAGWQDGQRLNSSGIQSEESSCSVTGYIPVKNGDVVTVANAEEGGKSSRTHLYNSKFEWVEMISSDVANISLTITNENAAYLRHCARFYQGSDTRPDTIITVT